MTAVDYPAPPARFVANEWFDWMADHPRPIEAIQACQTAGVDTLLLGHAVGQYKQHRHLDRFLAERMVDCPVCEGSGEIQPGRDPQHVIRCVRCWGRGEVLRHPAEP